MYVMTADEKKETLDGYVERFRLGEIGPVTFRALCTKLGVPRDEIDALRNAHIDACAASMMART